MRRSKGFRSKTRNKLKTRRRVKITDLLKEYAIGDRVAIVLNPSVQDGMPHPRFHGKVGRVIRKRGRAYVVEFKDGNKRKEAIALPVHLKKVED